MNNIPPPPLGDKDASVKSRLRFDASNFDQVIAISQSAINSSLASAWTEEQLSLQLKQIDEDDPAAEYVVAELQGTLLSPTIELSTDAFRGHFYINLGDDAKISVRVMSRGQLTPKWYDVPRWSLAWEVEFTEAKIKQLPERQRLLVKDLHDYTPRHVYVNFSNSNLLHPDEAKSYTPMPASLDPSTEKDKLRITEIRTNLALLVESHLKKQIDAGKNVLGYALTASTLDTSLIPTLSATDVAFQNYPYYNKGHVDPSEVYSPWSAFCFLNTLAPNKTFPRNEAGDLDKIRYTGNLVTPFPKVNAEDAPQMAGSLVIKRDCFIPTLAEIFKTIGDDMFLTPDWVRFKSESTIRSCDQDFGVKRGAGELRLDYHPGRGNLTWETDAYERKISGGDAKGLNGCLGANEGNLITQGQNTYSIDEGEGSIRFKGWSTYRFEWHTRIAATWWNQGGWPAVSGGWDWEFVIRFTIDPAGCLKLKIEEKDFAPKIREQNNNITVGYYWDDVNRMSLISKPLSIEQAKEGIEKMNEAFKTAGIYVLPAAGQYHLFDPKFSAQGDLMVGMSLSTGHDGINGN